MGSSNGILRMNEVGIGKECLVEMKLWVSHPL